MAGMVNHLYQRFHYIDIAAFQCTSSHLGIFVTLGNLLVIAAEQPVNAFIKVRSVGVTHQLDLPQNLHRPVARFGGDEFAILLPNSARSDCVDICSSIIKNIDDAMRTENYDITASIGSKTFDTDPDSPSSAIKEADKALYTAKEQGRNRFVCA